MTTNGYKNHLPSIIQRYPILLADDDCNTRYYKITDLQKKILKMKNYLCGRATTSKKKKKILYFYLPIS